MLGLQYDYKNLQLRKKSVPFSQELRRYYCIKRVVDGELAKENYTGDQKILSLINYPIIFKNEIEADIYLLSKVKISQLPLYVVDMLSSYTKREFNTYIVGEYDLDE